MTVESYRQANPHCGKPMMQAHGSRWIVQMPPAVPLTTEELDKVHSPPYTSFARIRLTERKYRPSKAFKGLLRLIAAAPEAVLFAP